jgi:hypothetical protein
MLINTLWLKIYKVPQKQIPRLLLKLKRMSEYAQEIQCYRGNDPGQALHG